MKRKQWKTAFLGPYLIGEFFLSADVSADLVVQALVVRVIVATPDTGPSVHTLVQIIHVISKVIQDPVMAAAKQVRSFT